MREEEGKVDEEWKDEREEGERGRGRKMGEKGRGRQRENGGEGEKGNWLKRRGRSR